MPELVVLPGSTEEVQAVVRACTPRARALRRPRRRDRALGRRDAARGRGRRLARADEPDPRDRPRRASASSSSPESRTSTSRGPSPATGFFYAPDPSSQQVCTIGGNVAENSGGAHCLKNGFTAHHVTGLTLVLPDGEVVELGGKALDPDGPDLLGVVVGSEGTLGIVDADHAPARPHAGGGAHAAGRLRHDRRGRRGGLRDRRRRDPAVGDRDDGPAHDRGRRARRRARVSGGRRSGPARRARRRRRAGRGGRRRGRADLRRVRRVRDPRGDDDARRARSSGRAASRRSRRWAGWRPTTTCRTASCRGRGSRRSCAGSRSSPSSTACASATSSTRATATSIRSSSTTPSRARPSRRAKLAEAILEACLDAGGSLTGEHGVGDGQGVLDAEDVLRARPRGLRAAAARVRPARALQPGKVIPTPRLCGEVPGPVPRASAREDRRCRASLASSRRPRSLAAAHARGSAAHDRRRPDDRRARRAILEHEAGDLTCTVEAGVRLSALEHAPGRSRPAAVARSSGRPDVGALLARNLSGPLRHRFGAPRDLVLGVTLVLADGTIASAGGKVVKNVAGYDLGRLVCGSEGRLALIARVSLRLHPLPKAARTLVVETDDARARSWPRCSARSSLPSAVDVLHPGRVAVLFEGSPRAVEAQLAAAHGAHRRRRGGRRGLGRVASAPGGRRAGGSRSRPAGSARRSPGCARRSCVPRPASRNADAASPATGCHKAAAAPARRAHPARARSERSPRRVMRELHATASTAASACRPARPTCSGTRRWTRRAGGSI